MQSAIEAEFSKWLRSGGNWLRTHDRGVLLSLLLSIPPFIPLPMLGLLLALINFWLYKSGRLPQTEGRLIKVTLMIAVLSIAVGILLTIQILNLLQLLPDYIPGWISQVLSVINSIREFIHGNGRYTQA